MPRSELSFGNGMTHETNARLMSLNFNKISRAGLDAASVATSIGFTAAKLGTRLGVRCLTSQGSPWLIQALRTSSP